MIGEPSSCPVPVVPQTILSLLEAVNVSFLGAGDAELLLVGRCSTVGWALLHVLHFSLLVQSFRMGDAFFKHPKHNPLAFRNLIFSSFVWFAGLWQSSRVWLSLSQKIQPPPFAPFSFVEEANVLLGVDLLLVGFGSSESSFKSPKTGLTVGCDLRLLFHKFAEIGEDHTPCFLDLTGYSSPSLSQFVWKLGDQSLYIVGVI